MCVPVPLEGRLIKHNFLKITRGGLLCDRVQGLKVPCSRLLLGGVTDVNQDKSKIKATNLSSFENTGSADDS